MIRVLSSEFPCSSLSGFFIYLLTIEDGRILIKEEFQDVIDFNPSMPGCLVEDRFLFGFCGVQERSKFNFIICYSIFPTI